MDPMNPTSSLLAKLGSAIVHADEAMSENGVAEDEGAFRSLLRDPDVSEWIEGMNGMGLLPVKRDA